MRTMLILVSVLAIVLGVGRKSLAAPVHGGTKVNYKSEIEEFHAKRDASLKKNWLVITGLDWLKDGVNTVGSAAGSSVRLPSVVPPEFAKIHFKKDSPPEIEFLPAAAGAKLDGTTIQVGPRTTLKTDKSESPSTIEFKTVSFYLVDRPNGVGVRSKDTANPAVKEFTGAKFWPTDEKLRVSARWVPLPTPKKMKFQDVLGNFNETEVHGYAEFQIDGKQVSLYPTDEGQLGPDQTVEFIFRDLTSGKESYGAARYLSATPASAKNEIVLDFNKAYNPPCAYTAFATCPLPPPENVLKVAIRAGELKPSGEHSHIGNAK